MGHCHLLLVVQDLGFLKMHRGEAECKMLTDNPDL